jgi:hypothetical protein
MELIGKRCDNISDEGRAIKQLVAWSRSGLSRSASKKKKTKRPGSHRAFRISMFAEKRGSATHVADVRAPRDRRRVLYRGLDHVLAADIARTIVVPIE